MNGIVRKVVLVKGRKGFTLVELLIVVGIIVALAAVIVPNVLQFGDKGDEGARASELGTIQTAMDTMMADNNITAVTAHNAASDTAVSDFSAQPAAAPQALSGYLRSNPVTYAYCWNAAGQVTNENATSGVPLVTGAACA